MQRHLHYLVLFLFPVSLWGQSLQTGTNSDTPATQTLQQVLVKSYEQNRRISDVGAAIGLVGQAQLNRFSNTNILPAVNTIAGVRMEERSPGSYRLNIRGSSLRSQFGVRDVKVYFNEIPLTDPGGNTYLNGLGFYNFQTLEIIKGPAGSLYGAAIGGAMLIRTMPQHFQPGAGVDYLAGSYGLQGITGSVNFGDINHQNNFTYTHQAADGYRVQTNMRRDVASFESIVKASDKQILHAYMYYSDLYYQTPGALNIKEYTANPRQARPPVGPVPGAVQNHAAIYQKTFTVGLSNEYHFSPDWLNTTSVYGAYTDFRNPTIRTYEVRKEPHFGGRTVFQFKHAYSWADLQVNAGAEGQKGFFNTRDFKNNNGAQDSLQTDDDINNWQYMVFGQVDLKFHHGWIVTAGASFNKSSVQFSRVSSPPAVMQSRTFENKIAPRLSVLKKLGAGISVYGSVARGFSPPTVSELLKSSGKLGPDLQPEDGVDYELGLKGNFLHDRLFVDLNVFFFNLTNTIVQRIDSFNVSYYINAGSTRQNGFEAFVSYQLIDRPHSFISNSKAWLNYTFDDFHYDNFKQVNTNYSGNKLPGVAPQVIVAGLDIQSRFGPYVNITYTYSDRIALNDANSAYAESYNTWGARIGTAMAFGRKMKFDIYAGMDNLFDTKYSLGNDINAAVGRYFNAAPGVNYFAGVSLKGLFH